MERRSVDRGVDTSTYSVGDYDYWVATRQDEPMVRDILGRIATAGRMRLSFRREPDALQSYSSLAQGYILARNRRSGEYVGICERVVREAFINGEIRALPYLAGLRVVRGFRHRLLVLRGGFEAVRRLLAEPEDLPWALTSIMSDNPIARRVLGSGLQGMPHYEPVGEFSTFALLPGGNVECERARDTDLAEISALLMRHGAHRQFAACWRADTLETFARNRWIRPQDYFVVRDAGGRIRACAAVWDQSAQRQLVIAGYSPWLRRLRPMINLGARVVRQPRLPRPGERLRAAWLSHVAVDEDAGEDLQLLLGAARAEAKRRGLHVIFTGWPSGHPFAELARQLARGREYRSQLFVVRWPEHEGPRLDPTLPVAPELALL
jgi:hypothetical protein